MTTPDPLPVGSTASCVALLYVGGLRSMLANCLASIEACGISMSTVHVACPPGMADEVRRVADGRPVRVRVLDDLDESPRSAVPSYLEFGTRGFNDAMSLKLRLIRDLLDEFPHVVYSDLDVSWLRDPMPYLREVAAAHPLAFQTESQGRFPPAVCAGFVSLRSGASSRDFMDQVIAEDARSRRNGHAYGDQEVIQRVLEGRPGWLARTFFLPEALFVNGLGHRLLPVADEPGLQGRLDPFVLHANWCVGPDAKQALLEAAGAWLLGPDATAVLGEDVTDPGTVTVVYPVHDVRGAEVDRIRRWTREQDADPGRFRVVVVGADVDPSTREAIAGVLRPCDVLLERSTPGREADYWLAGADRATTPWVLLVEGHAVPNDDVVSRILARIDANDTAAAINCAVRNPPLHRVSGHMRAWFAETQASWARDDTWPRLHRAAFAIRRDALIQAGGLRADYGQFAPALLSARLHDLGYVIATEPEAVVLHEDSLMEGHRLDTVDYVEGELAARRDQPTSFMEHYFGPAPSARLDLQPARVVRPIAGGLASALAEHPVRRRSATTQVLRLVGPSLVPLTVRARIQQARVRLDERLAVSDLLPGRFRYRVFVGGHARIVRGAHLAWASGQAPASLPESGGSWSAAALPVPAVCGLHALEAGDPAWRWSEPVLLMRVGSCTDCLAVVIELTDARPELGPEHLVVAVDSRPVDDVDLDDGRLTVPVPPGAEVRTVAVLAPTLQEPGGRRLGLPIRRVSLVAAGSMGARRGSPSGSVERYANEEEHDG